MIVNAFIDNLIDLDRSPNTIRTRTFYLRSLQQHVGICATATTRQIREWLNGNAHWSESTRNTAIISIRACYSWAKREGMIEQDPSQRINYEPPAHVNRPIADDVSMRRALRVADPQERIALRLGAECGLRLHELVKVHHRDINGNVLTVLGKGRKIRRVVASPELLEDVAAAGTTDYLLTGAVNGHRSPEWAYEHIRALTGYPPHALRRRAAMAVYRSSGHDVRLVQKFLGHASLLTTMDYLGVEIEDLARASTMTRLAA